MYDLPTPWTTFPVTSILKYRYETILRKEIEIPALKSLSSEMDPAEIRLIRKTVIKERGEEGF